jgi:hypothetical protein
MAETSRRVKVPAVVRRLDSLEYVIEALASHSEETHGDAFRRQMRPLVSTLYEFWNSRQIVEGATDLNLEHYLAAVD